jgi:glycosyltransferase involved in cell wall biosynthesis
MRKRIIVIIPVFNDSASLRTLIEQLERTLCNRMSELSLLIVDDGSVPALIDSIGAELTSALRCRILTLKRNLGAARAIAIGIACAANEDLADIVVIMDADGEDNPADIPRLVAAVGDADYTMIAVGERRKRSEPPLFRMFYHLYRLMFLVLTGYRIRFGNLSAMPITAARRLAEMSELWLSLPATILRSRYPIAKVSTERGQRFHGRSHMNVVSLVVFGISAVAVFVEHVLTRMILGAAVFVAVITLASLTALILKIVGMATPGWLTTVLGTSAVILFGAAILCLVGLLLSIIGGAHTVPAPSANYRGFIARTTNLGADIRTEVGETWA